MADRGLDVLEKYDFEVSQTARGRGVLVLYTDKGLKVLKAYSGSGKHILWTAGILDEVNRSGRVAVDAYVPNTEGGYITSSADGSRYVVKEWYEVRDCDVKNFGDCLSSVRALAMLHNELDKSASGEPQYRARGVELDMEKHNNELLRIKKYLFRRNNRTDFELLSSGSCDSFYDEGAAAAEKMREFAAAGRGRRGLCHGSYNYHSVCFGYKSPVIIGFEKMNYNYLMCDLYGIVRKIMEKYDWDIKLGYKLLDEYDRFRGLEADDLQFLSIMFSYPEKFWKIMNAYYNSGKAWIPAKSHDKLKKVIAQNSKRLEFIRTMS